MSTPQAPHVPAHVPLAAPREPRRLSAGYGASWWNEGWSVFSASPGVWIGIVAVLFVLMALLTVVPFLGNIVQTLITPVLGGGVMLGCHALARGERLRLSHAFDGFTGGRLAPLLIVGLVMLAASIVLGIVVVGLLFALLGFAGVASLAAFADPASVDLHTLASFGASFLVVLLVGMTGATLIAMAYWFAPALVVLNGEEPVAAMRKSFAASWRNLGAMAVYGLVYIVLAILATLPAGLGWLVLLPVMAGSCYAGWRTIFA
jgi:uncharacterized membrane protein